jgi:hypothetical protein
MHSIPIFLYLSIGIHASIFIRSVGNPSVIAFRVGLDLPDLSLVGLVQGMQQVRSLCAWFGYRWDACERWSVLATGVTPVSLRCWVIFPYIILVTTI